jgi:hypothetical protein
VSDVRAVAEAIQAGREQHPLRPASNRQPSTTLGFPVVGTSELHHRAERGIAVGIEKENWKTI